LDEHGNLIVITPPKPQYSVHIYNESSVLMYSVVNGDNFKDFCSIHNLPHKALMKSYTDGKPLYSTISIKKVKLNNRQYKGWYDIKED